MSDEILNQLVSSNLESKLLKDFYSSLNDEDAKRLVIQNKKYNLHKEPSNIIDGEIENIRKLSNGLIEKYKNIIFDLLANNGLQSEQSEKVTAEMVDLETRFNLALDIPLNLIKSASDYSFKSSEVMPAVDRHLKGKTPKAKKPDQIKAEILAKSMWLHDLNISQMRMAIKIQSKLNLGQNINTILGWIKPFDPLKGKRKRKSKKTFR